VKEGLVERMKPSCRFFGTPQGCSRGNKCKFRHDGDLSGRPPCRFFFTSGCAKGDACSFRHFTLSNDAEKGKHAGKKAEPAPAKQAVAAEPVVLEEVPEGPQPIRQWSFGRPRVVAKMTDIPPDVRYARVKAPKLRVDLDVGVGARLRFLTKLECRKADRQEPVRLMGLFGALKGHPSLTWLDASGHHVCSTGHDEYESKGSAALRVLLHTAPNLTNLLLEDESFVTPFALVHLLQALPGSRIAKLSVLRNIEFFSYEDFEYEWEDGMTTERVLMGALIEAMALPQLVELSFCPQHMRPWTAPHVVHFANMPMGFSATRGNIGVAYFAHLCNNYGSVDVAHAIVVAFENARVWTPQRHGLFPWAFHQAANQVLLLARRFGVPREIAHVILGFLARHYPIAPLALDQLNHVLPFLKQQSLFQYLDDVEFPIDEIGAMIRERREATEEAEAAEMYEDHRGDRTDAEKARDAAYNPPPVAREFEKLLLACLREDNSPLSTQVFVMADSEPSTAMRCYVHHELDSIIYENASRSAFLEHVEELSHGMACSFVRTFFPPVKKPRKHVRMFIMAEMVGGVCKVPGEMCRMAQTQQMTLADEPNTTYI
jgi:hypothetical protein